MSVRAFGTDPADLEMDFQSLDRPALVTGIIEHCGQPAEDCWALSVGARIARLLEIVSQTCGDRLDCAVWCIRAECGAPLEFPFSVGALQSLRHEISEEPVEVHLPDGDAIRFRRPAGADLRSWRQFEFAGPDDARFKLVRSLATDDGERLPSTPGPWIDAVAHAMETADPLVAFRCEVRCPACETLQEQVLDLERIALNRLAAAQRDILGEVHEFARHYGWSETETLAVPGARRRQYRALIRAEEGR